MPVLDTPNRSRLAGAAFWAMMRRLVVAAGCIDAVSIPLYAALGAPFLALINLGSVALYALAYWLLGRRRNGLAVALTWFEVLVHSTLASLLIGWGSGFHYYLLMFIPAIVVVSPRRHAVPLVGVVLVFYLGLHHLCGALGPLSPLQPGALELAWAANAIMVFALFYAMASYYRAAIIKAEKRLLQAGTTDALTGLANRSHFLMRAESELAQARRRQTPTALILADVDWFKQINDVHGHLAGDEVLVQVAAALRGTLREADLLARWGGEEFLALLPDCDAPSAIQLAERLRAAVAALPLQAHGRRLNATASFGVAEVREAQDLQAALMRADQALYRSKREGRNRVSGQPADESHQHGTAMNDPQSKPPDISASAA